MARTIDQPTAAIRPKTARARQDTNGTGTFDGPNQRDENSQLGDNAERRENLTAVRSEQDNDRDESRENRGERDQRDGDAEQGSRREQWSAPSAGLDVFAPVLEAWKQVFTSWSELTDTMVKAQQAAFAGMIGAANATARNIKVGERRDGEPAFSGSRSTPSRTTASRPDRIEHDRR
jgi:hypothetical protein